MTEHDLVDVTVKVESTRVPEFYEMVGRWSQRPAPVAETLGRGAALEWGSESHDPDLAAMVWDRLTVRAQRLLEIFLDDPTGQYSGEELAEMADIPNGKWGVAGTLAWPGRHSLGVQRKLPLEFDSEREVYWMKPQTADLFRRVRARANAREGR